MAFNRKVNKPRVKKPIYKKWWVWLLVVFFAIGALGSGDETDQAADTQGSGVIAEGEMITNEEDGTKPEDHNQEDANNSEDELNPDEDEDIPALEEQPEDIEENGTGVLPTVPVIPETSLSKDLVVHYIDVGQADSMFIEFPNGETMLIDAGESRNGSQIVSYIRNLGYSKINYVVATHPHADHIGGMTTVINSLPIDNFYMPNKEHTTKTFEHLIDALTSKNVDTYIAKAGVDMINIQGLSATILSPISTYGSNLNDWSAVVMVKFKDTSFLFMGDAEGRVEGQLSNVNADVLKVGHHGSDTSSSMSFLNKVKPKHSIITVGTGNTYGHPTQSTLDNLASIGSKVYRTDLQGAIIVRSDGKNITVDKEPVGSVAINPIPTPSPKPQPTPTPAPTPIPQPEPAPSTTPAPSTVSEEPVVGSIVYITDTGTKYHNGGCRHVNKSKIEILLSEAKSQGYEPCGVCKP